jgi:hypothetical protein
LTQTSEAQFLLSSTRQVLVQTSPSSPASLQEVFIE